MARELQAPLPAKPIRAGQLIAGRYRIERRLSSGGMGSVWAATHVELGMPVAVKLMAPEVAASSDGRTRFAREAKAAAAISSPHVVKAHDYGVDGETAYLVMELLSGEDLGSRLQRERRLSLRAAATLCVQIAKGLRRAHEAGIIHRDLKPKNIFLKSEDDGEVVQILDFGIAKVLGPSKDSEKTETGLVLGSMHYMSPEQARGYKGMDNRTDLWSLGIILYRALTGELPFPGDETGDVIVKICTDPIRPVSTYLPELGAETGRRLDKFFAKALARDPDERFQTATELASAFASLAGLEVEPATPPLPKTPPPPIADDTTVADPTDAAATPSGTSTPQTGLTTSTPADPSRTALDPATSLPPARRSSPRIVWALAGGAGILVGVLVLLKGMDPSTASDSVPSPSALSASGTVSVSPPLPAAPTPTADLPGSASSSSDTPVPSVTPAASALSTSTASASARATAAPLKTAPRPPSGDDKVKRKFGF